MKITDDTTEKCLISHNSPCAKPGKHVNKFAFLAGGSCNADSLYYENIYMNKGFNLICGVDEAGRGPLAGPVYAAAVILPKGKLIDGVKDSKKLSPKKRQALFSTIISNAVSYAVASVDENEIDRINILNATHLAMQKAINFLSIQPDMVLIDGNSAPKLDIPCQTIVKGDDLSLSISCASILAKVSRDDFMVKMAEKYPQYLFEEHKGYGTKAHIEAIKKYGPCKIHRKSFLKKIIGVMPQNS
ncbi:MAG: ribonuclease HII [Oscillospiraceae bacterium]|nr:ribonuclease HII [Oscillospiraceae bacterium]